MERKQVSKFVLVSEVPLDEKNGAGMRAVLPYLQSLTQFQLVSLYLAGQSFAGKDLDEVKYIKSFFWNIKGFRFLSIFLGTLYQLIFHFKRRDHFLILPNSIRDVIMGLACRLFAVRVTVWIMDDFVETYAWKGRLIRRLCSILFGVLYRYSSQRIVVSAAMHAAYEKRFRKKSDLILGRTLQMTLPADEATQPPSARDTPRRKLRIVYVGSFISHYSQPVQTLKKILQTNSPIHSLNLDLEIDLYGIRPPPEDWLLDPKIRYRGSIPSFPPERLIEVLKSYDFGLIPYSFTTETERMMSLSFPSKMIDYLGASLPVFVVAPASFTFVKEIQARKVGFILHSCEQNDMMSCLQQMARIERTTYDQMRKSSYLWAQEAFLFDRGKRDLFRILFET